MQEQIANHAERGFVNMLKVVINGMPHLGEASVAAILLQVNNINGRYARNLVHRNVVVADHCAHFVGEIRPIAQIVCLAPNLVAHPCGIALRIIFLREIEP